MSDTPNLPAVQPSADLPAEEVALTPWEQKLLNAYLRCNSRLDAYKTVMPRSAASLPAADIARRAEAYFDKPYMQLALRRMQRELQARGIVDATEVMTTLKHIMQANFDGIFVRQDGGALTLQEFECMTPEQRTALKKIKYKSLGVDKETGEPKYELEVELYDKLQAAKTLSTITGLNETARPREKPPAKVVFVYGSPPTPARVDAEVIPDAPDSRQR